MLCVTGGHAVVYTLTFPRFVYLVPRCHVVFPLLIGGLRSPFVGGWIAVLVTPRVPRVRSLCYPDTRCHFPLLPYYLHCIQFITPGLQFIYPHLLQFLVHLGFTRSGLPGSMYLDLGLITFGALWILHTLFLLITHLRFVYLPTL